MIPIFYHDIVTPSGHPGDEVISALQKFIRRGETELAVRAAYELYLTGEELTAYLWRRLLVISAEDVGLGEPMAPVVVDALHRSSRELSRDSSDYQLLFVHAVRYLCACRKERGSSVLASVVKRRIRRGDPFPLPDYVYDMHTHRPLPGRGRLCPAGGPGYGGGAGGDRALGAGARCADERGRGPTGPYLRKEGPHDKSHPSGLH